MDVNLVSHLLCGVAYLVLALLLGLHSQRRFPVVMLIGACAMTASWALAAAGEAAWGTSFAPLVPVLDILRFLAWIGFLAAAYRAGQPQTPARMVRWAVAAGGVLAVFLVGLEVAPALRGSEAAADWLVPGLYGRLLLALAGLTIAEALVRQARSEGLWRVTYLCLGVGALLVYDLFLWSEALLFHRINPVLAASRGAISVLAVPLIAVAAARNPVWSSELNVARRAVLHTAIVVGVGIYMLGLALAGTALRATGGDWGLVLQAALVFGGLLLLLVLGFSPSARSLFRVELSRYLFTHRHDYREQWHHFAEALASPASGSNLPMRVLRAISNVFGCSRGGLWIREGDRFAQLAATGLPTEASDIPAAGRLIDELERSRDRVLELRAELDESGRSALDWLPDWLRAWPQAWILVPLVESERNVGFIVLGRAPARRRLDREDEELLRTAAHHAASYLVADRTARELEESRRFEEISRGLAFMAHDLRNLANDLTLSLANARDHIGNPDFQQDLLMSMEDSVAGMQRLLDKLAQRKKEPVASRTADFADLLRASLRSRRGATAELALDLDGHGAMPVACDPDQLVSMSGHLIQNAIEAAGPSGRVTVRLRRDGGSSLFEVEDDGPGMTAEFVRERLHHPFRSSKEKGYGLGLYECAELARQAGGELAIDSVPGRGTVARLRLPLAPVAPSETDA